MERTHSMLLRAMVLDAPARSACSANLVLVISQWMAYRAASIIAEDDDEDSESLRRTDAACIAVLSQLSLSTLSLQLLHDIALVGNAYSNSSLHTLASNLIRSALPVLQKSIVAGYIGALRNAQLASISDMYRLAVYMQALCSIGDLDLNEVSGFWTALQSAYDTALPALVSRSMGFKTYQDIVTIPDIRYHIRIKHIYVSLLEKFATSLPMQAWLDLLEAEGNAPDLPSVLSDLPITSLFNQTLLADAQIQFQLSDKLDANAPEAAYVGKILRSLIDEEDDVTDGKELVNTTISKSRKGKGKAIAPETEALTEKSGELMLVDQVQAILPDTAPELISRLLKAPQVAGLDETSKVERVIQMVLEGNTADESQAQIPTQQEKDASGAPAPSTFAARRANIFSDQIDLSKTNLGAKETDIMNDPFLPMSLKEAILQAAQNQHLEELEDEEAEEEERARFLDSTEATKPRQRPRRDIEDLDDDFSDMDRQGTVRVKDNIDEESDAEEEEDRMQAVAAFALRSTGGHLSADVENLLLSSYIKDSSVFVTSARRTPARANLKKLGNAGLSDEQIEGWARMLERNPRKDKILAAATEFRGNQKGMEVRPGKPGQQQKARTATPAGVADGGSASTAPQADDSKDAGQGHSSQGTNGGRGRGGGRGASKGNRGHQGDQRRRGHDKKMAKAGP